MLQVATWNVNSIKARLPHVQNWLEKNRPDILMLQEIKCINEKFPAAEFAELGYHASVKGMPAYHGVATLSKKPARIVHDILPGDKEDIQARFIEIEIDGWRFINVYAPNGNPVGTEKFTYKLQWLDRLQKHLQALLHDRQKFVIGGDFNIIPENVDARHPEQWRHDALFQVESRRKWRALNHLGLTDAYRSLYPQGHDYSFWEYTAGAWQRDDGIRIDHFLLSPNAADLLADCRIDREPRGEERPSDHTPVIVSFHN